MTPRIAGAPDMEHGANYVLTVKDNQATLRQNIDRLVRVPPTAFLPL